jgi:hypothetical protein
MSRDQEPPSPMTLMARLKQSLEPSRRIADSLEVVPAPPGGAGACRRPRLITAGMLRERRRRR